MEANGLDLEGDGYLNTGDNYGDGADSLSPGDKTNQGDAITEAEKSVTAPATIGSSTDGGLVLPALHGAGDEIMLLLSVSENFGEPSRQV